MAGRPARPAPGRTFSPRLGLPAAIKGRGCGPPSPRQPRTLYARGRCTLGADMQKRPPSIPGRNAPATVKRTLRQEVGHGCPVSGCASPYLEYHHFDPPWAEENHHRPEGMIALCGPHHDKAGGGAFTAEQLRQLKKSSYALSAEIKGTFEWRRQHLVARVGGNFYLDTPVMVEVQGTPVVSSGATMTTCFY